MAKTLDQENRDHQKAINENPVQKQAKEASENAAKEARKNLVDETAKEEAAIKETFDRGLTSPRTPLQEEIGHQGGTGVMTTIPTRPLHAEMEIGEEITNRNAEIEKQANEGRSEEERLSKATNEDEAFQGKKSVDEAAETDAEMERAVRARRDQQAKNTKKKGK
jgi:hypothetical protein